MIAALFSVHLASPLTAQTTWIGATNSNWFTSTNWDTNVVPNGITFDVIVGSPSPTLVNGDVNINSLNVGAAGVVTLNSGQNFDFGGTAATTLINAGTINTLNNTDLQLARIVNNSGSINVTNTGSLTDLEVTSDGATLTGGGTITLGGAFNSSRIMGVAGSPTLAIANQTLQGRGQIGANTLTIINQANGLMDANSSGNLLTIDPSAGGMTNMGTMRASSGGVLQLNSGNFNNAGGLIEAQTGSTVRLTNSTIVGGTLSTSGTGLISVDTGTNSFLENLTIIGNMETQNNTDLGFSGTINNTGSISVTTSGSLTDIEIQTGGATLTGGGTITLQGNFDSSRIMGVSGSTLTIANQTIQGRGNIGADTIGIVNQTGNLIDANSNTPGSQLTIDPSSVGMTNQGTLRASNGGVMVLTGSGGGAFTNTGGLIEALEGSEVQLTGGVSLTGGTLSSTGTGLFRVITGQNVFLTDLTHTGQMIANNNIDLGFSGTINNTGSISVINTGSQTDIEVQSGGATLTGGGTITLQGIFDSSRIMGVGGSTLTIANQTIQGRGNIGANSIGIVNQAGNLINANSNTPGSELTIDPSATGMTNQGTLRASNGGVMVLTGSGGGAFTNTGGLIEALEGSEVQLTGDVSITGGTLSSTGTGLFRVITGQDVFLTDLTHTGQMIANNNVDLGFSGTINNTGSISVINTGSLTDIEIQAGGATLTGGGTITLQGSFDTSRIDGVGGATLTIDNQIIQGRGNVGTNTLGIVNGANGIVHANSSGNTLTVDPSSVGNFVNQGTLRASGGGELLLTGNGGGAFSGGGTFEALDGGLLRANSTAAMNSFVGGTISEGNWRAIDSGNGATIRLQNNAIASPTSIGANASVELSGANSVFTFNLANNSIDNSLNDVQGALTLRDGRVMSLAAGLTNSGSILVDGPTTSLGVSGDFSQVAGSLILASSSTVQLAGVSNTVTGGLVGGNGTIVGDLDNLAGTLSPGLSPGSLGITGGYLQGASASFDVEIGGLLQGIDFDFLNVGGDALLDGNLLVSLYGGFTPTALDMFTIMTGSSVSGVFSNAITQVNVMGGGTFDVTYTSNSVVLKNYVVPEPSSAALLLLAGLGVFPVRRKRGN